MGDGSKTFLQNICNFVSYNTASDPNARNLYTSHNDNFKSHNIQVTKLFFISGNIYAGFEINTHPQWLNWKYNPAYKCKQEQLT
jgi:hypothetical protein